MSDSPSPKIDALLPDVSVSDEPLLEYNHSIMLVDWPVYRYMLFGVCNATPSNLASSFAPLNPKNKPWYQKFNKQKKF